MDKRAGEQNAGDKRARTGEPEEDRRDNADREGC